MRDTLDMLDIKIVNDVLTGKSVIGVFAQNIEKLLSAFRCVETPITQREKRAQRRELASGG